MSKARVLVVEDDRSLAEQLRWGLQDRWEVRTALDREAGRKALDEFAPDIVVMDLCVPPDGTAEGGIRFLAHARSRLPDATVVVMSGLEGREAALSAVEGGAHDFFAKPVDLDVLRVVLARAEERTRLERENRLLRESVAAGSKLEGIVGRSEPMRRLHDAIRRVADSHVGVLIQGESGTGKELVARAIHFLSARRAKPFVPVHCAALPEHLLEAELFGHERGAFTGAVAARAGRFEAAQGGTLFLDEVSCLEPATQVKLLRVLEDRAVERLGSNATVHLDIRVVAATNEDLKARVAKGTFREDLYFRLHVFPLRVPPLRERREDTPLLAAHFLDEIASESGRPRMRLAPDVLAALMTRDWPGNVRELRNAIESLTLLADGEIIGAEALGALWGEPAGTDPLDSARALGFKGAVEAFERRLLLSAIQKSGGVMAQAAKDLGLNAGQMKYLSQKYRLGQVDFSDLEPSKESTEKAHPPSRSD